MMTSIAIESAKSFAVIVYENGAVTKCRYVVPAVSVRQPLLPTAVEVAARESQESLFVFTKSTLGLFIDKIAEAAQPRALDDKACTSPEGGPCSACGAPTATVERVTTYRCRDHRRNPRPETCGDCAEDADAKREAREGEDTR